MSLSLLDLPTETLLHIFEDCDLPVQELYSLALLCRRLHLTALPVYFSRQGLESKSLRIAMRTDLCDPLAALRTALFVPPHPDDIAFVFPHPSTSILQVLEHFNRIQGYLTRIPPVNGLALK
ncbi:hypothetical protein DFH06DRAFT_1333484 [Mycena polygramma]|nr:hypothetical protein DFH06DRAFT_1333484 [Mycena polygramma]